MNQEGHAEGALRAGDDRLPAVRARLFLLVRSLWKAGILQVPLSLSENETPPLRLLHPLWERLRLELVGEQLLRDIIPAIERHLATMSVLEREESGMSPRAPVDWPASWRRGFGRPAQGVLITRRWKRETDLPENQLAVMALRAVSSSAALSLQAPLSEWEAAPIRLLRDRSRDILARPPWRDLAVADSSTLVAQDGAARIRQAGMSRPAYAHLLSWWQQWNRWSQPIAGAHDSWDAALEPDWLFELLLLFELVYSLSRHLPMRQSRALGGDSRHPVFVAQSPAGPLSIYYQTGSMFTSQRSLEDIWGIPDIVIQMPGTSPSYVILDAKNYGSTGHTQAIYKLLGYLYQYGYSSDGAHRFDRIHAGILAFPTREREEFGLRNWQRDSPDAQAVLSFVLPPLPDERYTGLGELVDWLLRKIPL